MPQIVIATSNPHKVEEIAAIFAEQGLVGIELLTLAQAAGGRPIREPVETGTTFAQNAAIKAASYAEQLGMDCLADDSGLEIDALGGRPGVISSHYCTDGREEGMPREQRDRLNNERVLKELEGVPAEQRTARFVCVMALADHVTRGTFEGRIGLPPDVPRGSNGFGYDPLFLVAADPYGFASTSAELAPEEKNRLSHRGQATREMARRLRGLFTHPA